jgi:hypothetical protein
MVKRLLFLSLILLTTETLCSSQIASNKKRRPPKTSQVSGESIQPNIIPVHPVLGNTLRPVELPQREGAWAVQIVTRGGVMGTGKGDLIITSEGEAIFTHVGASRTVKLLPDADRKIGQAVASTKPTNWNTPSSSLCNDCYITMLALYRRDAGIKTYIVEWDDVTTGELPDDVTELYATAMSLKDELSEARNK